MVFSVCERKFGKCLFNASGAQGGGEIFGHRDLARGGVEDQFHLDLLAAFNSGLRAMLLREGQFRLAPITMIVER